MSFCLEYTGTLAHLDVVSFRESLVADSDRGDLSICKKQLLVLGVRGFRPIYF